MLTRGVSKFSNVGLELIENDLGSDATSDFTGPVPAHTVGHDHGCVFGVDRDVVFIILANAADVGERRHFDKFLRHVPEYFAARPGHRNGVFERAPVWSKVSHASELWMGLQAASR